MDYRKNNLTSVIIIIIILFVSIVLILGISNFLDNNSENDILQITESIDDALITAYALDGSYPSEIEYLANYGIMLNNESYYYDYQFIGYNIKPTVIVTRKNKEWKTWKN